MRGHSLLATLYVVLAVADAQSVRAAAAPQVALSTAMGEITIELDPEAAPLTVANFLAYVRAGFYDGTLIHRVVRDFMLQGGGLTADMEEKRPGLAVPIRSEADNGRKNLAGTVAMARQSAPDSAASQFFINLRDNDFLDREQALDHVGYAVFGRVVAGMAVVRQIELVRITARRGRSDVPVEPIVIRSAREVAPREVAPREVAPKDLTDTSAPLRTPPAAAAGTAD